MIVFEKNNVKLCDFESSITLDKIQEILNNNKEIDIKSTIN